MSSQRITYPHRLKPTPLTKAEQEWLGMTVTWEDAAGSHTGQVWCLTEGRGSRFGLWVVTAGEGGNVLARVWRSACTKIGSVQKLAETVDALV